MFIYTTSRSDRVGRVGGGVLLYTHKSIPITASYKYDDGICQVIFCLCETVKMLVVVLYRPPDAPRDSFSNALSFVTRCIKEACPKIYSVCLLGDFNFPFVDWCSGRSSSQVGSGARSSAGDFFIFQDKMMMNQYIHVPTRLNIILDLFVTNNPRLVTNVSTYDTLLSDHKVVDIMVSMEMHPNHGSRGVNIDDGFRMLNFFKADYNKLRLKFRQVCWAELFDSCSFQEFPVLFT